MSVDDREGRCPRLVLEGSIADSAGKAISDGRNDGARKIWWKSDFLDGPRQRSQKGIECLRKRQWMFGNRFGCWRKLEGQKSNVLSLKKRDCCSASINQTRRNGAATVVKAVQRLLMTGRDMVEVP